MFTHIFISLPHLYNAIEFNEIVCKYEALLHSSEVEAKRASDRDAKKIEQLEKKDYERRSLIEAHKSVLREKEEKLKLLSFKLSAMKSASLSLRKDLTAAQDKHEELISKYDTLVQRQEHEMQRSTSSGRKEAKKRSLLFIE